MSFHKEVIDEVAKRMDKTPDSTRKRASLVEHPFGTFKDWTGNRHLLGKGLEHAEAEVKTTFWSYNFKRALKISGMKALIEAFNPKPTSPQATTA